MAPILLQKECTPKCRSQKHVEEIICQIPRISLAEFKALSYLCHNWSSHSGTRGCNALHFASSTGKLGILQWLLENGLIEINSKDLESGYTALHRSLLYGQLAAARLLIQVR